MLVSVLDISAQSYPVLWKKVQEATDRDQPQEALKLLEGITSKAEKENSYGDLFASLFCEIQKKAEISEDSILPATWRLVRQEAQLRESGKTVAACILRTALFAHRGFIQDESLRAKVDGMRPDIDSLLSSPDAKEYTKSNVIAKYAPLAKQEIGSKYFSNNLLSLIAMETNQYPAMRRYFEGVGNAQAVAIIDVLKYPEREFDNVKSRVEWIDGMLGKWGKWEGVNELRNERQRLSYPTFAADVSSVLCHSFDSLRIYFNEVRSLKSITVTITPQGDAKPLTWTKNFAPHAEYETFRDSLDIGTLPIGVYTVSMESNPKTSNSEAEKLYVSDLMVVQQAQPGSIVRYVVVDAKTGNPVPKAKLHFVFESTGKVNYAAETDEKGEYKENNAQRNACSVYASTDTDNALFAARTQNWYTYHGAQAERKLCNVYPARKVYRPGQTVEVVVMAYSVINGTEMKVRPNADITLKFFDPKHKTLETKNLKTDEYGMTNATFTLPKVCTNGIYVFTAGEGTGSVRVEEYVRPTFDVTIETPKLAYRDGDTITVKGVAKMYSGVPVGGARVVYNVSRRNALWWMPYISSRKGYVMQVPRITTLLSDTIMTEADGSFTMRVPMVLAKEQKGYGANFMSIETEATVTDAAGETHSDVLSLSLSNRESCLSTNLPERILADSAMAYTIRRFNNAGTDIPGKLNVIIDGKEQGVFNANENIALPAGLASGLHTLTVLCERDTLKREFVVFRLTDQHPTIKTHDWFYQTSETFPADGGEVALQFGSSDRNGYAVYSIFKENTLLESGSVKIDSSLVIRRLAYKEEFGDGILFTVAWVRDGVMYTHKAPIRRSLPSKSLKVEWSTFRNLVEPGKKETWTVRVSNPDGTPAKSALTASLFDKSLDAIVRFNWEMVDSRYINLPITSWNTPLYYGRIGFYGNDFSKLNKFEPLVFSHFDRDIVPETVLAYSHKAKGFIAGANVKKAVARSKTMGNVEAVPAAASLRSGAVMNAVADEMVEDMVSEEGGQGEGNKGKDEVSVRENFNETAAFFPCIETDDKGIAKLTFTLPESVTTWRFISIAHDKDMRFGTLEDEIVAQKKLMVQPRMPRFLRETDTTVIPASISNLSGKPLSVKATMTVLDQKTNAVLADIYNKVSVNAGETAVTEFPLDASKFGEGTFIVRVSVEAVKDKGNTTGFTDGEQHLLPILSSKEHVVNTLPLVLTGKGSKTVNVADMLPADIQSGELNVDYTDSPAWLLLKSLPFVKGAVDDNTISLASAFYSNTLAAMLLNSNPDSKSLLSFEDGEKATLYDAAAMDLRAQDFYSRLSMLQLPDGSWSWWRGMRGSTYITVEVMKTLLRLNNMVGLQRKTTAMLNRAYNYLDAEAEREIREMKKAAKEGVKPTLNGWLFGYLYCQSMSSRKKNVDYLLEVMQNTITGADSRHVDMATKAEAAVILALQGKSKSAKEQVESIIQHTVSRDDVGRYFDSYRAGYSWYDYRIPTQVSSIEAIRLVSPERKGELGEMQRWLLSSKRTQSWDTPINAVNAVYAFFGGDASTLKPGTPAKLALDGKPMKQTADMPSNKNVANTGFTSASAGVTKLNKELTINKSTDTESWASVSVSFLQEQKNIEAAESGFTVSRSIALCLPGGKKKELDQSGLMQFKTGDKVTVTITIKADRDYDFVTVTDNRASCLEPINQLSGYSNGAYTVKHDTDTEYCFDMFRKGTRTITTDYYVTRPGVYTAGTVSVKCTYAPEFTGRTRTDNIAVAP